jgi:dTDP-4-amino-4,6-dideoxygalactose transaminase
VIPLAKPEITDADIAAVATVLRTGQLVQGSHVAQFERAISEFAGGGEVIAVSNGTAALHLSLLALGVGLGDRVGVAAFSWPATANAVVLCGAHPVFLDVEPVTLGVDPDYLDRVLTDGPRLSALVPVHAFGSMANMPKILALADAKGVPVVEDAACALGAVLHGQPAGSWGRLGCFSFHPRKAATTGEGGAIRTADKAIASRLRSLRNHGVDPGSVPPDFIAAGFNARLTEFQAALGISQLTRYQTLLATRRELARGYNELLSGLPVDRPATLSVDSHIYQSYVVTLHTHLVRRRSELISNLKSQGIETNIGTHHQPLLSYYRQTYGFKLGDFPVTDRVAAATMALPLYPGLTSSQQEQVVSALRRAIES